MSWQSLWKAFVILDMAVLSCVLFVVNYSLERGDRRRSNDTNSTTNVTKIPFISLQLARQSHLRKYCSKAKNTPELQLTQMLVSQKHSLVYCGIPKAAITNWIRVLLQLNGQNSSEIDQLDKEDVHLQELPKLLSAFKKKESMVRQMLKSFKFTFVRHPFVRLVSAYRNKFQDVYTTYYQETVGSLILKKYRRNLSRKEYKAGKNVTFYEFVRYIIDTHRTRRGFDVHWEKMVNLCFPCSIKYDFIGKIETLNSDSDEVLRQAGLEKYATFPKNKPDKYEKRGSSVVQKYFSTIPKGMVKMLYRIYSEDFEAFGYAKEIP